MITIRANIDSNTTYNKRPLTPKSMPRVEYPYTIADLPSENPIFVVTCTPPTSPCCEHDARPLCRPNAAPPCEVVARLRCEPPARGAALPASEKSGLDMVKLCRPETRPAAAKVSARPWGMLSVARLLRSRPHSALAWLGGRREKGKSEGGERVGGRGEGDKSEGGESVRGESVRGESERGESERGESE